jgi:hypothetical protein
MLRNLGTRRRWQRSSKHSDTRWPNIVAPELPERGRACENRVARSIATDIADERGNRLGGTAESVYHRQHGARREVVLTHRARRYGGTRRRRRRRG